MPTTMIGPFELDERIGTAGAASALERALAEASEGEGSVAAPYRPALGLVAGCSGDALRAFLALFAWMVASPPSGFGGFALGCFFFC